jgi:hypothetical protein
MPARLVRGAANLLTLLSLLACLPAAALWVRSLRVTETVSWSRHRAGGSVLIGHGRLVCYQFRMTPAWQDVKDEGLRVWREPGETNDDIGHFLTRGGKDFTPPLGSAFEPKLGAGTGGFWFHAGILDGWSRRAVMVPLWFLVLATALPPLHWLLVLRRRRSREVLARQGRCAECGYDLRASGDVCPECGHAREVGETARAPARRTGEALAVAALPAAVVLLAAWVQPAAPSVRHLGAPWLEHINYDPTWAAAAGAGPGRMSRRDEWGIEGLQSLWRRGRDDLLVVLNAEQYNLGVTYRVYVFDRDMHLVRRGWSLVGLFDAPLEPQGMTESAYCLLEVQRQPGGEWDLAVGACRPYFWDDARPVELTWDRILQSKYDPYNLVRAVPVEWDDPNHPDERGRDTKEPADAEEEPPHGGIRWAEPSPAPTLIRE